MKIVQPVSGAVKKKFALSPSTALVMAVVAQGKV